ncbi:MAG: hypothetical protein UV54_C0009G0005 [Candidatus Beckwithbacteria bacterium GW2011_GWA2_43_10]|uniref:Uncharacterized protein n=1 Tax=Candidatus Beckwithbacteria bacterium GW2011_GWA2_43_10 TaxID=1618369 RepID=A0A0G1C4H7_9BACT|nr:MAG: hypothetical protein UV54_C0009G0005 [Candidatus Beckwithbacteria bacterium GW2011_GWA2_43_10]
MNYKTTKKDCELVIQRIIEIFGGVIAPSSFDLIVYGSYATDNWRDGASDLDSILYFKQGSFSEIFSAQDIAKIQLGITELCEKMSFLQKANFFSDVFILDKFHGDDGRFVIYDKGFIHRLLVVNKNYSVVWGNDFLSLLSPVSLRHQEEFQLAIYLQEIRKFLIFEMPRLSLLTIREIPEVYKFLKTLPRFVHIILGKPINSIKEGLDSLCKRFPDIDYDPLYKLEKAERSKKSSFNFIDCWQCYEKTLMALVANSPMRSVR